MIINQNVNNSQQDRAEAVSAAEQQKLIATRGKRATVKADPKITRELHGATGFVEKTRLEPHYTSRPWHYIPDSKVFVRFDRPRKSVGAIMTGVWLSPDQVDLVDPPELQQRLVDANIGLTHADFAYHATDLYVVALPGVREWLKANYEHYGNVSGFVSPADSEWRGAGQVCLDIPFAGHWPGRDV